ncbi:MAG: hypothetical protein ACYC26_16210 [Phycisphaerales bacterium]
MPLPLTIALSDLRTFGGITWFYVMMLTPLGLWAFFFIFGLCC